MKNMPKSLNNNQQGLSLIAILVAITIIAAIFFGSSYFSDDEKDPIDSSVEQIEAGKKAEEEARKINQMIQDRNNEALREIE